MIFAAIDPGAVHAAIAVFHDGSPAFVDDIRTAGGMLDATALAHALSDMQVDQLVVENVHAMPRQGVSSTFCALGRSRVTLKRAGEIFESSSAQKVTGCTRTALYLAHCAFMST
jgi:hypothetical protein